MLNFSEWLVGELTSAKTAIDQIPQDKRKGYSVGLFRLRAREAECAMRLYDEYEIWRRFSDQHNQASGHRGREVKYGKTVKTRPSHIEVSRP